MAAKGISKITIPLKAENITIEAIDRYIQGIYATFTNNAKQIRQDYNKYKLDHKILTKERVHQDSVSNNKIVVPDLFSMVNWKAGYLLGNPMKYARSNVNEDEALKYLNRYIRDVCKRSTDKKVAIWTYATGVGYYYIAPKSVKVENVEYESPFEIFQLDSDTCCKIYSSYIGNEPLFDIIYNEYNEIQQDGTTKTVKQLYVYLPKEVHIYTLDSESGNWNRNPEPLGRGLSKPLPLVEKRFNDAGIGIVALGEELQNAVDSLISDGLDNVSDRVNSVFVYLNALLDENPDKAGEKHREMLKNGAIQLLSTTKDFPADLKLLAPESNAKDANLLLETINSVFHAVVGVPLEMSETNSGGTTKQGSEVSNGYDNAYNRAIDDVNTMIYADYELLEKMLWICRNDTQSKIQNLYKGDIEIKYAINLSENILAKAQAYSMLITSMPPAKALEKTRLSCDPEAEGKAIEQSEIYKNFAKSNKDKEVIEVEENNKKPASNNTNAKTSNVDDNND